MKSLPSSLTTVWIITGSVAVLFAAAPQDAGAQFHEKQGDKVVPRTPIQTAPPVASSRPQASYQNLTAAQVAALAAQQNGTAGGVQPIATTRTGNLSSVQPATGAHMQATPGSVPSKHDVDAKQFHTDDKIGISDWAWNLKITEQQGGEAEIAWGRAKHHPNGNYTISKVDQATLIQRTFSPPRTAEEHQKTDDERQPIERRVVQLDAAGRPAEVFIYDIRDQLKFRGVLVYDNITGRFLEEQLLNPSNQIIRRRVQRYDQAGRALPIKTYMDEDAIHGDTSLVLTGKESPTGFTGGGAQDGGQEQPKERKSILDKMMFWKK
jgi:hypothetical protein